MSQVTRILSAIEQGNPPALLLIILRIVGAVLLVFSVYHWIGVFVPRWSFPMRWKRGKPIGTFGRAGLGCCWAGWGAVLIAITVGDNSFDTNAAFNRVILIVLIFSFLAPLAGGYLDEREQR